MKKKIGILTWHYYENFGSALQAFALQQAISYLGYDVKLINYRNPKFGTTTEFKRSIQFFLNRLFPSEFDYPFLYFQKKYLNETRMTYDKQTVHQLIAPMDLVVFGSDQIWAPNVFNSIYMGDIPQCKNIPKISYAASIGLDYIPQELKSIYIGLLGTFKSVLVREEKTKDLLKHQCNIESDVVLDPTLLIPIQTYKEMENKVDTGLKRYVFCYFLNQQNHYATTVKKYCKKYNVVPIGVSANPSDSTWLKITKNIGPREFLWLVSHAEMVFTDSYHGTIFSLLYHKNFLHFMRFETKDMICQNSRIIQLAKWFDISDKIVSASEDITNFLSIDYEQFEKDLQKNRKISFKLLSAALE